jgi:hypothetical protein
LVSTWMNNLDIARKKTFGIQKKKRNKEERKEVK